MAPARPFCDVRFFPAHRTGTTGAPFRRKQASLRTHGGAREGGVSGRKALFLWPRPAAVPGKKCLPACKAPGGMLIYCHCLYKAGICVRIVIKVGTSTLAYETGRLNIRRMEELCRVMADLKNAGHEIILVSSGAIAMGWESWAWCPGLRTSRGSRPPPRWGNASSCTYMTSISPNITIMWRKSCLPPRTWRTRRGAGTLKIRCTGCWR